MAPVIVYCLFCIFWGIANGRTILGNNPIIHWANGLIHVAVCVYFGNAVHWLYGFSMFFLPRLFFDIPLNLSRGLDWNYVSPDPHSWVDQQEKAIFHEDGRTPKFIYLTIIVIGFVVYSSIL